MRTKFSFFQIFVIALVVLVILNLFNIRIFDIPLFFIGGHAITLLNILVLSAVVWAFRFIPSPFKEVLALVLILWVFSLFGGFLFAGIPRILLLVLVLVILISFIGI